MPGDNSTIPRRVHRSHAAALLSNIIAILTATMMSQIITVVTAPLLTRIYTPHEFAGLTLFVAAAHLLSVVTTLRYELGVVLARRDRTAALLSAFTFMLLACVTGVVAGATLMLGFRTDFISWLPLDQALLSMLPLQVFLLGFCSLATRFHMRQSQFRFIAVVELVVSAITLASQIAVGVLWGPSSVLLVTCVVVGRMIVAGLLGYELLCLIIANRHSYNRLTLTAVARRFRRFPMYTTFSELAGQSTTEAPNFMLGTLFPIHVLGMFSLATRVLEKPISLANASVQQAFYKFTADNRHQPQEVKRHMLNITRFLVGVVALPTFVLLLFAEPMFEFAFGSQWREAGQYAKLLIPMLVVRFTVLPTCWALFALQKHHVVLIWNLAHLVQGVGALAIGGSLYNSHQAILAFSVSSAAMYCVLFYSTLYCVSKMSVRPEATDLMVRREAA